MKNATSVKNEGLAAWAVTLLRELPGAPVVSEALPGAADDGSLRFSDAGLILRVEQKAHVDPVIAHSIEARNAGRSEPLLVVARTTTSVARENPVGGTGSRCGSDQRAVMPSSVRAAGRRS